MFHGRSGHYSYDVSVKKGSSQMVTSISSSSKEFGGARDRRRFSRFTLHHGGVPVICERGSQALLSKANSLGESGLFVFTTNPLPVGSACTLELGFAPKTRVQGRVRSKVESIGMGVEFVSLDDDMKSRLAKWIEVARLRQQEKCA
jgi:hypothetical protein